MTSLHLVSPLLFDTERWRLTICKYTNMDIFQTCTWLRYIHWRPPPPQERTGLWQKHRRPHRAPSACSIGSKQQGGAEAPPKTEGSSPDSALPAAHSPPPQDKWVLLAPSEHSSTPSCYTEWSSQRTHWGRGGSRSDINAHTASSYSSPASRNSKNVYIHTSSRSLSCMTFRTYPKTRSLQTVLYKAGLTNMTPSYAARNYFKFLPTQLFYLFGCHLLFSQLLIPVPTPPMDSSRWWLCSFCSVGLVGSLQRSTNGSVLRLIQVLVRH